MLASGPENYMNYEQEEKWPGLGVAQPDVLQYDPWNSSAYPATGFPPCAEGWLPGSYYPDGQSHAHVQQVQQMVHQAGLQAQSLPALFPELHPGLAGAAGGQDWQVQSSWCDPNQVASFVPQAQRPCRHEYVRDAPRATLRVSEGLPEQAPPGISLSAHPDAPKEKLEPPKNEVDRDFEQEVTNAVNLFLQGDDVDSEDDEFQDLGMERTAPERGVAPESELKTTENKELFWAFCQFAKRLQKMIKAPEGGTETPMTACSSDTPTTKSTGLETEIDAFLGLIRMANEKAEQDEAVADLPEAEPTPKPSLQLEQLVCTAPARRVLQPELQRGQCIGAMLKMKPLPPGVTPMHMAMLEPRVKNIIKLLIHMGVPPTLSNIRESLRQEGIGEPVNKALLNLCHIFSNTFCLWVPEVGEMSIVLLEKPLLPLDDQVVERLQASLTKRLNETMKAWSGLEPGGGGVHEATVDLAEDLAKQNVTTLMIKNLPTSLQQPQVLDELARTGFAGKYDFFYMPGTFTNHKSLGYAFVNLVDVQTMKDFVISWTGKRLGDDAMPLRLCMAAVQGRDANAQNFGARMQRIRNPSLRPVILDPNNEAR